MAVKGRRKEAQSSYNFYDVLYDLQITLNSLFLFMLLRTLFREGIITLFSPL
jgi:hypothetical protein